jgi:DNA-binding transcriptional LysR family regulator
MNHLNFIHLKYFCDAASLQSVSEAAKKNFVSQSAISHAIAKLEKILDVELITHSRKHFQITEEGRLVFEHAGPIFKTVRDLENKIFEGKNKIGGTVNFVCTNSLGSSFIAPVFKEMQLSYPQVDLKFKLGNLHFIRNSLNEKRADFAIVVYDKDFSQFDKIVLFKGKMQLYHSAEQSQLFETGVLVDSSEGMHVAALQETFKIHHHKQLKIQAELAGWEVVAQFTKEGIGTGFFPDYIRYNNRFASITPHPFNLPHFDYEICAIHHKGEKLSRAALAFIDKFLSLKYDAV